RTSSEYSMAIFGKDRERNERGTLLPPTVGAAGLDHPAPGERERSRGMPDEGTATNAFLGKGSRIVGKLTFEGPVRIEGNVGGRVSGAGSVAIGGGAGGSGQDGGNPVVIQGRGTGDGTGPKRLEIRAAGKVYGNISSPSLVIQEGVVFEGQCNMG